MKKLAIILLIFLSAACTSVESGYLIEGRITKEGQPLEYGIIYLREFSNRSAPVDSADIKKGKFRMTGKVEFPDKYLLYIEDVPHSIPFFLENDRYAVTGSVESLREANVTGGDTQTLINFADSKNKMIIERYKLNDLIPLLIDKNTPKEQRDSAIAVMDIANKKMRLVVDSLTNIYPLSFYSLNVLAETAKIADLDVVKDRFLLFEGNNIFDNHPYMKKISEIIAIRELLVPGMVAPDFILPDVSGNSHSLSKLFSRGEITLLIFWNSMSEESVDLFYSLKSLYDRYSKNGFNIVGIAVGDIESSWKKTTAEHSFKWIQLFDTTRFELTNLYNITTIPYNILVDSRGVILEHNVPIERLLYFF